MANGENEARAKSGGAATALPRWRQIQHALERDIRQGVFKAGQRLPSEEDLAARFDVHRNTVRRAVARLREKEIVSVQQGGGTYVKEPSLVYPLGRDTRLTLVVEGTHRRSMRKVLASRTVKADRATALALGVPVGHAVLRVDTLRYVDGRPLSAGVYHYLLPRFSGIDARIDALGSISAAMREYGVHELVRRSLRVRAHLPTAREATLLEINRAKPILDLYGISLDEAGKPVQTNQSKFVSSRFDLLFKFDS